MHPHSCRAALGLLLATAFLTMTGPATAAAAAPAAEPRCTAGTGPYQWQLERYLRLKADGRQSTGDCEAIRRFQRQQRIEPADGYAGLPTYRLMLVAQAGKNPNARGRCPVRRFKVACVDLDRQLLWVQRNGTLVYKPVPIRSGRNGEETRTGRHRIYLKKRYEVSRLYDNAPMPYSQYFSGGQALHGTPHDLFNGAGSAGCVNLRLADAARLWRTLRVGDLVYVWGHRSGTKG
ncbi:L,D-transpeptidase family protein [Streptomyces melanogenes]|uniref:L,D-transpeptidase family protein n=1 Tax=Streptomyces melanogenes TaxID=67326 RepID=UPI00167DEF93|nr:L,D-transpeptidase family protein [Streptomyces melanogenes]GGP86203.1 murein L,D-transpeptidase [Streptomyces melanogenes]